MFPIVDDQLTVDQHIFDAFGKLVRIFVDRHVLNGIFIKNEDVGKLSFHDQAGLMFFDRTPGAFAPGDFLSNG